MKSLFSEYGSTALACITAVISLNILFAMCYLIGLGVTSWILRTVAGC